MHLHKRHANATCSCVHAFAKQKDVRESRFGVRMRMRLAMQRPLIQFCIQLSVVQDMSEDMSEVVLRKCLRAASGKATRSKSANISNQQF